MGRFGVYYGKRYKSWLKAAPDHVKPKFKPISGPVAVHVLIVCKRPVKEVGKQPLGDIDNYVKAALDMLTQCEVWEDDRDVTRLVAVKRYARKGEDPCTVVKIKRIPRR